MRESSDARLVSRRELKRYLPVEFVVVAVVVV